MYNLQLPVRSATWNLASHSIVYIWLLWYLYCELLWSPTSKSIQSSMEFSRELLQEKTGMKIDQPSSEGGTTSTGYIARSCFMNKNNFIKWILT